MLQGQIIRMIKTDYDALQNRLNYQFNNKALLTLALTHRSCGKENNERLEFLGDALLNSTIAQVLYFKFPDEKEGVLSRLRSQLVKGKTLAKIARQFELSDYLIMGAGELKSGGYLRDSVLADVVEAIIGAIYLDKDTQQAECFIRELFKERVENLSIDKELKDPKTRLQEYLQAKHLPLPKYSIVTTNGLSHEQTFTVSCETPLLDRAPSATASSRRQAEQNAADMVLTQLENSNVD